MPLMMLADALFGHVVMTAPEEGRRLEGLLCAEYIARRRLPLAFGGDEMLDPDPLAAVAIRPARDIAGGEDARSAGFEIFIDEDAVIDGEAGLLGERRERAHADADDDEIGRNARATRQSDMC